MYLDTCVSGSTAELRNDYTIAKRQRARQRRRRFTVTVNMLSNRIEERHTVTDLRRRENIVDNVHYVLADGPRG